MDIQFSTKKIIIWLSVIVVILHAISTGGRIYEYLLGIEETTEFVRLFHVAEEGNITAWFSSLLHLISAVLLAVIAKEKSSHQDRFSRHWFGLSIIFLYISIDEAARIHEIFGSSLDLGGFF